MPRPYPSEFRDDVVRVARNRDDGVTIEQIAADFGVHPMTLSKWMRQADIDEGAKPGKSTGESAELRELRRRNQAAGAGERGPAPGGGVSVAVQSAGKRLYPLVNELAADGIPVAVTCRVLKLARQPYYRWLANPVTDAELAEAYRANALFDAHRDDPEFGYRYLVDEARDAGEPMAERTAWRICSEQRLVECVRQEARQERQGRPAGARRSGRARLHRRCTKSVVAQPTLPNIRTGEGKLYLCAIKDVFSNRIVGYSHRLPDEVPAGDHRAQQRGGAPR